MKKPKLPRCKFQCADCRRDSCNVHLHTAIELLSYAEQQRDAALALLREMEWSFWDIRDEDCCPICREREKEGHAPDCSLAALLKAAS